MTNHINGNENGEHQVPFLFESFKSAFLGDRQLQY